MVELIIKLNMINDIKEFLNETRKIKVDVDLYKGKHIVDAKSIVGVFTVDLSEPVKLVIHSNDKSLLEPFKKWTLA